MIKEVKLTQYNHYNKDFCNEAIPCYDADGDSFIECSYNGKCQHQKFVKDCDGDIIVVCYKY